jgi:hypothetical protein
MRRSSQEDHDGLIWDTASLRVGAGGLDLRRPGDPASLTELLNARFLDEATACRRDGHVGLAVRSAESYSCGSHSDNWVYGHGNIVENGAIHAENTYIPRHRRGGMTFQFGDAHVVWTGDRLFTMRDDGHPAVGESAFWWQTGDAVGSPPSYGDLTSDASRARGIPAYLPVMTDTHTQFAVPTEGCAVDSCLTPTLRVAAYTAPGGILALHVYDRTTGAQINHTEFAESPVDLRVINSGGVPVVLFRDATSENLLITDWNGTEWSTPSLVTAAVNAYDTAETADGFHLLTRVGGALKLGKYLREDATGTPYAFNTVVTAPTGTPSGPVGVGVSRFGELGLVIGTTTGIYARALSASAEVLTGADWATIDDSTALWLHASITPRGLANADGRFAWVIHCDRTTAAAGIRVVTYYHSSSGALVLQGTERYNCTLASKGFRVGEEVFAWVNSTGVKVLFLLAGALDAVVAGYADRQVSLPSDYTNDDGTWTIHRPVHQDPLDEYAFTWTRPYLTGVDQPTAGNALIGDLQFLPHPTAVQFGRSVYLSGSCVKNWDGHTLADAGFHDYPTVASHEIDTGSLLEGDYQIRVYPVRYNMQGERFMGPALTYSVEDVDVGDSLVLTINTIPSVSTTDVVFEVYRTTATGTTFYYEGSVDNDLFAPTVEFTCTMADGTLDNRRADPHRTGVGSENELEEWGPIGCAAQIAAGDRLWGFGGQVPPGLVEFSKLWEPNEGPGFDDLAEFQTVDAEGGEITSMIGFAGTQVAFQRSRLFIISGDGPNNYGRGAFDVPQSVAADGAVTHFGTHLVQDGVVYWGESGPRLLTPSFRTTNISRPVEPLAATLLPTGVRVVPHRQEVIWYTSDGSALLWNYTESNPRWARWSGLHVAGVSPAALVTTDGVLLLESPDAAGDDGQEFEFRFATGNVRPEDLLQGHTHVRRVGLVGSHHDTHQVRFRVYYDGSPLWSEQYSWDPQESTWLTAEVDVAHLTPGEIDALLPVDRSGQYDTNRRLRRQTCNFVRVEVSDRGSSRPTFTPYALSFELGARPGLGRTPVNTFEREG